MVPSIANELKEISLMCDAAQLLLFFSLSHRHLNGLLTIAAAAATECVDAVLLYLVAADIQNRLQNPTGSTEQSGRCDRFAQPGPAHSGISDIVRGLFVC